MKRSDDMPPSVRKMLWVLAQLTVLAGILLVLVLTVVFWQALWELVFG